MPPIFICGWLMMERRQNNEVSLRCSYCTREECGRARYALAELAPWEPDAARARRRVMDEAEGEMGGRREMVEMRVVGVEGEVGVVVEVVVVVEVAVGGGGGVLANGGWLAMGGETGGAAKALALRVNGESRKRARACDWRSVGRSVVLELGLALRLWLAGCK